MKVTEQGITRIEFEPGDQLGEVYDALGDFSGNENISFVNGAIQIDALPMEV